MSGARLIDEKYFSSFSEAIFSKFRAREHGVISYLGEESQFIRFNRAKVRQTGTLRDSDITLKLILEGQGQGDHRETIGRINLTGDLDSDLKRGVDLIEGLRTEVSTLPPDPFCMPPKNNGQSSEVFTGDLLPSKVALETLIPPIQGVDLAGIYASGWIASGNQNSAGQKHWFETETFCFDYSLIIPAERSVKGTFFGRKWETEIFRREINSARERCAYLEKPIRKIPRGNYRTYLSPDAVQDLVAMFSWGAIGEASFRQGDSPLIALREKRKILSPLFSLREDFTLGGTPRFNWDGEIAPQTLKLIEKGELKATLVSSRSSLEYGVEANGAEMGERMRSPFVPPGTLKETEILNRLGTGLYLSNLHYLNYSDSQTGRITGMTRYACYWVEDGKIQGPIENLRFDETLFRLFGSELEALTDFTADIPNTSTYEHRQLGIARVPGALIKNMEFTL